MTVRVVNYCGHVWRIYVDDNEIASAPTKADALDTARLYVRRMLDEIERVIAAQEAES